VLRGYLQAYHSDSLGSRPGQSIWDLWWTKWPLERVYSKYFGFHLSVSSPQRSTLMFAFISNISEEEKMAQHGELSTKVMLFRKIERHLERKLF
jgi:hypothetical protein